MSPESTVYLCDKQVDLPNDDGSRCVKAVKEPDGIELLLTLSGGGREGAVYERQFCGRAHANYWLTRQRLTVQEQEPEEGDGDAEAAEVPAD